MENETQEQPTTTEASEPAAVETTEAMMPVSEGVTLSNDSADDAILDELMGGGEEAEESSPKESIHPGVADEAVSDETPVQDPDSSKPAELSSEDYGKAVAALQRDGVPRSVIDQMAEENPQSVIDWGLKRAKVQADVDGYGAKVKELESKLAESGESSDSKEEGTGEDQSATQPTNAVETINRYESEISDIFGEDAATSIMTPIRELVSETTNALQQQQGMIQKLYQDVERRAIEDTRGRLGERFPRLSDDESFATVVDQMSKLATVGEYETMDDLMADAYRLRFAEVAEQDALEQKQHSLRESGQPTVTSQTSRPAMSKSVHDREDDALDALLSGKGYDGASAAYNG